MAFALLDAPEELLNAIDVFVREVGTNRPAPGKFRRTTLQKNDMVVSLIASFGISMPLLIERTEEIAQIERYRRRVTKSIAIGVCLETLEYFDHIALSEGAWEPDEKMEKRIQAEPMFVPTASSKLPEVNAPCYCGSGKKYKKCCRSQNEASRHLIRR